MSLIESNSISEFQDAAISKLVTIGSNLEEILRRIPVVADDGGIAQSSDCPRFPVPSLEKLEELNQWLHREGNLELLVMISKSII